MGIGGECPSPGHTHPFSLEHTPSNRKDMGPEISPSRGQTDTCENITIQSVGGRALKMTLRRLMFSYWHKMTSLIKIS